MDDLILAQQGEIEMLRERIRQLEEALAPSSVFIPVEYRLTGREACVFAHLVSRDVATKESIMLALYSGRPDEEPEIKIVDVFVCKMRKKLSAYGVNIRTIWGQGYSLENRAQFAGGRA